MTEKQIISDPSEKLGQNANIQNAEHGISNTVRLDPFGNTLVPAPTNDPMDPLNWTKFQKYICIIIVCIFYFLFTYQTTAPIPSFALL
jgi:hypothetical protein